MNKRNLLLTTGGAAALGLALIALPVSSAGPQKPDASTIARLQQRIDELEAKLQAQIEREQNQQAVLADAHRPPAMEMRCALSGARVTRIPLNTSEFKAHFHEPYAVTHRAVQLDDRTRLARKPRALGRTPGHGRK